DAEKIIERSPVDVAEHQQNRICGSLPLRELQRGVHFVKRAKEDCVAVSFAQLFRVTFRPKRLRANHRPQSRLALKLPLMKAFDAPAEVADSILPIRQRRAV